MLNFLHNGPNSYGAWHRDKWYVVEERNGAWVFAIMPRHGDSLEVVDRYGSKSEAMAAAHAASRGKRKPYRRFKRTYRRARVGAGRRRGAVRHVPATKAELMVSRHGPRDWRVVSVNELGTTRELAKFTTRRAAYGYLYKI